MKSLTEILKNIKTRGKNLAVYSSMLLALTGAYACGGSDNPDNNAADAQVLQDGGNSNQDGSIATSLNCDELCKLRYDCGCFTDIDEHVGDCQKVCEQDIDTLSSEFINEINKCFSNYPNTKICNSVAGDECLQNTYSACVPGCAFNDLYGEGTNAGCYKKLMDKLKPINEVYCKKASECNQLEGQTEAECIGRATWLIMSQCLNPNSLEKTKACIEGTSCSSWDMDKCQLAHAWGTGKEQLLQIYSCKKGRPL